MEVSSGVRLKGVRKEGDVSNPLLYHRWPASIARPILANNVLKRSLNLSGS